MKPKALITGGSGFIGTHVTRALLQNGFIVANLDLTLPHPEFEKSSDYHFFQGDLNQKEFTEATLTRFQPNLIYHLAAMVSVPECELKPKESMQINFNATLQLIEIILRLQKHTSTEIKMVFASSAAVYGNLGRQGIALDEKLDLSFPVSQYAFHKLACEQQIRLACQNQLKALSLRFFNVYGPGQKQKSGYSGIFTVLKANFERNEKANLFNHGNNFRDFIRVEDIANACSQIAHLDSKHFNGSSFNLATGREISILSLFEQFQDLYGLKLESTLLPPRIGDVQYSLGNIQKIQQLLPEWKPSALDIQFIKS